MAGVVASGVFVGQNELGQLTANPAGDSRNLAAIPPEDTFFGTPLGDLCKEETE